MAAPAHKHMYYRFEGLLLAIDFFTQRFDTEQLSAASFEFVNEILTLHASALFMKENNRFVMKQKRLYNHIPSYEIGNTEKLKQLVLFRGHTMVSGLEQFLEEDDIRALHIKWLMPLMIGDTLHGFIVSNGNISEEFTEDDMVMANTLMRLINNSLENSLHYAELQMSNAKLDQKNFNLFAINQSTKVLMSEMSLASLHEITTDVFSEVTASQITSFGIVDPLTRKLTITGYRNVLAYTKFFGQFELVTLTYDGGPIVLHTGRDRDRLQRLFVDTGLFRALEAEYVILIVQERIVGMITLSKPVNDERKYDEPTFELIESLANSAFIAISNAMLFEEANRQRKSAETKLKLLQTLNRLVKNVSECGTREELCYFTVRTLQMTFHIRKVLICLRQGDQYVVVNDRGFHVDDSQATGRDEDETASSSIRSLPVIGIDEIGGTLLEGSLLSDYTAEGAALLLPSAFVSLIGSTNCCVIAPLTVANRLVLMEDPYPLGFIIVLETEGGLEEDETLLVDTIAKNISPILYQMSVTRSIQEKYKPDGRMLFLAALQQKINDWHEYRLEFHLYYKPYRSHPFDKTDPAKAELKRLNDGDGGNGADIELFCFDGHLFAFSYEPLMAAGWTELPHQYDMDTVMTYPVQLPFSK
ncbi:GAF domain-containing protein [Paenibacillus thalictri]|uniref:GAF domain-containing protein n=1 Tax=Paenibacillus thalictri TaxID=2527873 RepID=A0A4Q9DZG1_9BACL|nr:GAF domain-containing protein [Paenibacillus thalictri]TBL81530.1 hypothetical protein EYB31_00495 [Paenibacillus thalictri]